MTDIRKILNCLVSLVLCVLMVVTSVTSVAAQSTPDEAEITSASMDTNADDSNLDEYFYSQKEYEETYPDGLYVVEYASYGVYEGGSDSENPEDVYLGINVYRLGGNNYAAEVPYNISAIYADEEMYPESVGTVRFDPQQVKATANIKIINDDKRNGDQVFGFALGEPDRGVISKSSTAIITITDDEPYIISEISVSVSDVNIDKSEGGAEITITRTKNSTDYCTLVVYTTDGTAKAGVDYEAVEEEVVFGSGETEKIVTVPFIQSDEKFTSPKNFSVGIKDLKACKANGDSSIRVDFTNKLSNDATKLTEISKNSADLEISSEDALTDSATSVVNINDTLDRKQMLLAAVGAANGTAVQAKPDINLRSEAGESWGPYVYIPASEFKQVYSNGSEWTAGSQYNDGNQNVMISSTGKYNLNNFTDIYYSFDNTRWGLNGHPNTAVGYFEDDGTYFNENSFYFQEGDLGSDENSYEYQWNEKHNTYILKNFNNQNVSKFGGDFEKATSVAEMNKALDGAFNRSLTRGDGTRYEGSSGYSASNRSIFFMLYDDEGWDDHHFNLEYAVLKRAIIPFSIFNNSSVENLTASSTGVKFRKDGYDWEITAIKGLGGIGTITEDAGVSNDQKYGFYAGSMLKVTFSMTSATGQSAPVPEYLYFDNIDGVPYSSAKANDDGYFTIPLDTIMSKDITELQNTYHMTENEAREHIALLDNENEFIGLGKVEDIFVDVSYTVKHSVKINYGNIPTLKEKALTGSGKWETDAQYIERLNTTLDGVIRFFFNGEEVTPAHNINTNSMMFEYPEVEFDYIRVTPSAMGLGVVVTSNLSDVKYGRIETVTDISKETCNQSSTDIMFTVMSEETTYINPTVQLSSVSAHLKKDGEMLTSYVASPLDNYIPFEVLYPDTSINNKNISYYRTEFYITDIYVEGVGNCEEKVFDVYVYNEALSSEQTELFKFEFTGGKTVDRKQSVKLELISNSFKKNDNIDNETSQEGVYVDVEGFKPFVNLIGYSSEGYKYEMYIPSYFCADEGKGMSQYYDTVFKGSDGVRIEIKEKSETTEESETEEKSITVAVMDVFDSQYVCMDVPEVYTEADGIASVTPYSDVQQEFYTYRDNMTLLATPSISGDITNLSTFMVKVLTYKDSKAEDYNPETGGPHKKQIDRWKRFAGSGVYLKSNNDQIVVGGKLSFTSGHATKVWKGRKPVLDASQTKYSASTAKKINVANAKMASVALTGLVDANVQFTYDEIKHTFVFTKFTITGNVSVSFTGTIPIYGKIVYFAVTTGGAFTVGASCEQVLNYVDYEGVAHYKTIFGGAPMSIGINVYLGVGIGLSGVLSFEGGGTMTTGVGGMFGRTKFNSAQVELDIWQKALKPDLYTLTYNDNSKWIFTDVDGIFDYEIGEPVNFYGKDYAFNDSLVKSQTVGNKLTINCEGVAFQLLGDAMPGGGTIKVTLTDESTEKVIKSSVISTDQKYRKRSTVLFNWNIEDYLDATKADVKKLRVEIEHIEPVSGTGNDIILDSFIVYNPDYYVYETIEHEFTNFYFNLAVNLKFTIGPVKINIDPAYMNVNVTEKAHTVTLGIMGLSKTWITKMKEEETEEAEALLVQTGNLASSISEDPGYFDTGDYGSEKQKTLLAEKVTNTSETQVIYHNDRIYTFFTVTDEIEQGKYGYRLHCSVDGGEPVCVSPDESFVYRFKAFEDEDGNLAVIMVSADGEFSHFGIDGEKVISAYFKDGSFAKIDVPEDMQKLLNHTCVKTALIDEDSNVFSADSVKVIEGTDTNGRFESIPTAADSNSGASVVFYVSDEKTDVEADYNLDFNSRVEEIQNGGDTTKELYDVLYNGRNELYYAVCNNGEITGSGAVRVKDEIIAAEELKPGYKIMEVAAVMADEENICVAYSVEIPYVSNDGLTGTLKELYYRTGTINSDSTIDFSEKLVVESVVDYDVDLNSRNVDTNDFSERYYNAETGEFYSTIMLGNLQMANANICKNDQDPGRIKDEPCLFYQTNASINYVTATTLNNAKNGKENDGVGKLYDKFFDDYVIAVSEDGAINLVYCDNTEAGGYMDTLYFVNYSSEDRVWTKPRRLTYSEVFDQEAFDDYEATASLAFDNFDAYVNSDGEVNVVLRSSYIPFTYDYGTDSAHVTGDVSVDAFSNYDYEYVNEDGETVRGVITPLQDYDSEFARSDIYSLTFKEPVTDVEVTDFVLTNDVFVAGETIDLSFAIENVGDTTLSDMAVEAFYKAPDSDTVNVFLTQECTGSLFAGDTIEWHMEYEVSEYIPDGTLFGVQIRKSRDVFYNSYEDSYLKHQEDETFDNITYKVINNSPEFTFGESRTTVDANGILNFDVEVLNYGTKNAENNLVLSCKAYDSDIDGKYLGTVFTYTISKNLLETGDVVTVSNKVDASQWLIDGKLYFSYTLDTKDDQFSTENDYTDVVYCNQMPEIQVQSVSYYESAHRASTVRHGDYIRLDMMLGEEIVIDADVLSDVYKRSQLVAYEVGTDCISIENNAGNNKVKVKAVSMPDGKAGTVKMLLHLKGTSIYKYVYINITNKDFVEFDNSVCDSGWTLSGQDHVYAVNFTLVRTETNNSEINFSYFGDKLEIIGDRLINGGDMEVTISDSKGNVVEQTVVSTAGEKNGFGKVLYTSDGYGFGKYTVKIKALIDNGEKLSLDRAKYLIDRSTADLTPYAAADYYTEQLDAPLVNGRQRTAKFTLTFNKVIELAEGKNLSDLTLSFAEYESNGGEYTATGEKVTFTASEIKGKNLIFKAPLSSKQGYVMKYILEDSNISEGFITDTDKNKVKTAIPDYDTVSYVLKESGILSVTVVDDAEMPDASVHKSVQVKFMKAPDTSRLDGTKILYKTTDKSGKESTVEFNYITMTNDPRVAVYRADSLELDEDEMSKIFSFEDGIVLNENNYVLVTADGDYLDNDITTVLESKSDLDIVYSKAKADFVALEAEVKNEKVKPLVYVNFSVPVSVSDAINNAYITVKETCINASEEVSREITLKASGVTDDKKSVIFSTTDAVDMNSVDSVEYSIISDKIRYANDDKFIVTENDKIAVNPEILSDTLKFNTDGYIGASDVYVNDENVLFAELTFSTSVKEESLTDTYVKVTESVEEYGRSFTKELELKLDSTKIKEINGNNVTVAVYKYTGDDAITLEHEEVSKKFAVNSVIGNKGNDIVAENGTIVMGRILAGDSFEISRIKASEASIKLLENGDNGYNAQLTLKFPENIKMAMESEIYSTLVMTTGDQETILELKMTSIADNSLTFVTTTPFTLESSEVITFETPDRFIDVLSNVVDTKGIGVSEDIKSLTSLLVDTTGKGMANEIITSFERGSETTLIARAKVSYDEVLRQRSFENSYIKSLVTFVYANGERSVVNTHLDFDTVENENTAVYKAEISVPSDVTSVELIAGDSITESDTNRIYNADRTLFLNTSLPESDKIIAKKLAADITAIVSLTDGSIENLSDTAIAVTYPGKISVEGMSGITLKAKVEGIKGIEEITYTASQIYADNTLVFMLKDKVEGEYSNVVTVSLENASIVLQEGSSVYNRSDGIFVNYGVNNISEMFLIANPEIPTIPDVIETDPSVETEPDVTEPVSDTTASAVNTEAVNTDSTTEPAYTEPIETTEEADTETTVLAGSDIETTKATEVVTSSDKLDADDEDKDAVITGRDMGYITVVMALMLLAFATIVIIRAKKHKQ